MIDPHVHCEECHRPVVTVVKVAGGKTKPAEVKVGMQNRLVTGPNGQIAAVQVSVPLCDECWERIHAAEQQATASKLIVPGVVPPADLMRPQ